MAVAIKTSRKAFSLIELVIVVVIIGIIAAIAIPKMSRGATGASEAALAADLQMLRNALEMYQAEHNGSYPDANLVNAQLTSTTLADGTLTTTAGPGITLYGPYMKNLPTLPVGVYKGAKTLGAGNGAGIGWVYNADTGIVSPNVTGNDSSGNPYSNY